MKESDVEIILRRAREKFPDARPRIISDNGPQFIARDFKEFIRISGMTRVKTSPYYPQGNGKLERYHSAIGYITPADKLQGRAENNSGPPGNQAYRRQRGPESSAETTGLVMKR